MKRRQFVRNSAVMGGAFALGVPFPIAPRRDHDLIIRNGWIVDGTGRPRYAGDVAIDGDRIAAVGQVGGRGAYEIDATGHVVCPGFIDIHSHAELSLFVEPRAESRIRQGVTLDVVGQDGGSVGPWSRETFLATRDRYSREYNAIIDFSDPVGFLGGIDRLSPAVNVATMIGQGTVRGFVVGGDDRPATREEIEAMYALVLEAVNGGVVGLSSGLEYTPGSFASTDEIAAVAAALQGSGLPYASHMRNEDDRVMAAVEEAIHVGRMAGVPVQIAHLKAQGQRNYWKAPAILSAIEDARAGGVDVNLDRYPYVAYSTGLANLFPASVRSGGTGEFLRRLQDPALQEEMEGLARAKIALLGSWDAVQITSTRTEANAWARGRRLGELAAERGVDPYELARTLIVEEENGVGMIGFGMSEENTEMVLAHPLAMVCSDGGSYAPYGPLSRSSPHPRGYGTFPRLMGHYVREREIMSLETAVKKVTSMPADKLRIAERGRLQVGAMADVTVFDPDTIRDRATFEDPHQYPDGIPVVVVNGVVTLEDGEHTGRLAGRAVRPTDR